MTTDYQPPVSRVKLPLALFLLLLAAYLFTYTPRVNSSDGLAMFATAESLVRRGALDVEQIRWMDLQQGTYGLDGLLYSRKGVGVPLGLLPLTALGLVVPWFGPVSASLLFNAVVTALTGALLLVYLQMLGFSAKSSLLTALAFGLGTLAWPYAKSLFSDPFSGLLLLAAALALLKFRRTAQSRWAALAGLLLGWNVTTRYAEAIFLPVFGLLLLAYLFKKEGDGGTPPAPPGLRRWLLPVAAFCAPILLTGLALLAFNLSRYGDPFNTGYLETETFSAIWLDGLAGQLFSPGRGLFLFSPILLLSVAGVVPFFRRRRAETLLALSVILIHLLLYGKWFMWHGGYAWGPRFIIPTLPFWALLIAPILQFTIYDFEFTLENTSAQILRNTQYALRIIVPLLFAASILVQIPLLLVDFSAYMGWLLDTGLPLFARDTFFGWGYSPWAAVWQFVSPATLDLAWGWQGQVNWALLAALLANMVVCGVVLKQETDSACGSAPGMPVPGRAKPPRGTGENWVRALREAPLHSLFSRESQRDSESANQPGKGLLPVAGLTTLSAVVLLLAHAHSLTPPPVQAAVAALNRDVSAADAVITNNPALTEPFAERYTGRAPVLGLNNGGFPLPADVTRQLDETMAAHRQIWWLPNWLPPEQSAVEQTLLANWVRVRNEDFAGQRLVLFAAPPAVEPAAVNIAFGESIRLISAAVPDGAAGSALTIELKWQVDTPVSEDYHVFVHLLNAAGETVAQSDGQPAQWTRPTATWRAGETITDRHGLWLPAGTPAGDRREYQLQVGLYQPETGQRLLLATGADAARFELSIR